MGWSVNKQPDHSQEVEFRNAPPNALRSATTIFTTAVRLRNTLLQQKGREGILVHPGFPKGPED